MNAPLFNPESQLLQGLNVISLGINTPAPVAAWRLAKMGARITKVEPPGGDPLKGLARAWYEALSAGQTVITLDLKDTAGRARLDALLATADLLLASFRPSAMRRLHLDWETLHARHPQLCFVGITGYPPPLEERSGHDLTYLAGAGLVTPPELPSSLYVDLAGAERCVSQALALLLHRARTGEAACATVSLHDCAVDLAGPMKAGLTVSGGLLRGAYPLYGLYETSDGWIALAALEPRFAQRLLSELGLAHADRDQLALKFRERTAADWQKWAEDRDLPLVAVQKDDAR
jgi:alpha-methylacyl-CoA racemase